MPLGNNCPAIQLSNRLEYIAWSTAVILSCSMQLSGTIWETRKMRESTSSRNLRLSIVFRRDVLYCNGPLQTFRRCKTVYGLRAFAPVIYVGYQIHHFRLSDRRTSNLAMYRVHVVDASCFFNSLRPRDAIWRHRSGSTLAWRHQVITCTNVDLSSISSFGINLRAIW